MTRRFSNTSVNSAFLLKSAFIVDSIRLIISRNHLCGLDINLTYPQTSGHFPTIDLLVPDDDARAEWAAGAKQRQSARQRLTKLALDATAAAAGAAKRDGAWLARRDLSMRANGTIDTWYGCLIYDEMIDYALNFSAPWSASFSHVLSAGRGG